jgi:ATP-dependent RNA helicase DeaD
VKLKQNNRSTGTGSQPERRASGGGLRSNKATGSRTTTSAAPRRASTAGPVKRRPAKEPVRRFTNSPVQSPDYSMYIAQATPSIERKNESYSQTFDSLGCSPELLSLIAKKGYTHASEIQAQVIPSALQGFDILGMAETGSGKTAAFLLPLIEQVLLDDSTCALILAPTRELATQINEELRTFTAGMRIFSTVCVGGMPIYKQAQFLSRRNHFIIGTPGRIEDLIERRLITLSDITAVVLDEVDYMMDIGFVNAMIRILDAVPETRQTLFFSATMPDKIQHLCERYLNDPEVIEISRGAGSKSVEQDIVRIERGGSKIDAVCDILKKPETQKTILFCDTKRQVEDVTMGLKSQNVRVAYLHGDLDQRRRFKILEEFKSGKLDVLCASDVAARGIDVKDITTVINYTPPQTHDDYVHRIGRAGRAGNMGYAYTLFYDGERPRARGGQSQNQQKGRRRAPRRSW